MDSDKNSTKDLMNIISKAMDTKMYGSVEVYLEEGSITQITQRIIKKISRPKRVPQKQPKIKSSSQTQKMESNPSLKYQS